jgi:actin
MNVPGFCLFTQAVLSLVDSGRTTGLVLDSGDGVTQAVPISGGQILSHAIGSIELGGKDITEYLAR